MATTQNACLSFSCYRHFSGIQVIDNQQRVKRLDELLRSQSTKGGETSGALIVQGSIPAKPAFKRYMIADVDHAIIVYV